MSIVVLCSVEIRTLSAVWSVVWWCGSVVCCVVVGDNRVIGPAGPPNKALQCLYNAQQGSTMPHQVRQVGLLWCYLVLWCSGA